MKKLSVPKIKQFFRELNYRHYICVGITAVFIILTAVVFPYAFGRFLESGRDFGRSIAYWFVEVFGLRGYVAPSVTSMTKMPFTLSDKVPATWEAFKTSWGAYWALFKDSQNFIAYLASFRTGARGFSIFLAVFVPLLIALFILVYVKLKKNDKRHVIGDTKPLRIFKKVSDKTYRKVKPWLIEFRDFVKYHKCYVYIWALIWAFNFNLISIGIEGVAYYYYFMSSFDTASLYGQLYKLLLDMSVMFKFIPAWGWFLIGCIVFNAVRKYLGYQKLYHHEANNCGFINDRGVSTFVVAPMRMGKTKVLTSMSLSAEVGLRRMAYDVILECDLKFPYFPWLTFERSLKRAMKNDSVYNLATARRFVLSKMIKFYKHPKKRNLFGYDFERYGLEYDNARYIEKLEDVLKDYAQAYFVYICQTSLIISNYAIRVDNVFVTKDNFPKWINDFFKIDSRYAEAHSRYSHIINYDDFHLGVKVCKEHHTAFEFGVINITEIAKECLNQVEMQGIDKNDEKSNPKNDGFVDAVKMIGHNATIAYRCFVIMLSDDQREQNLRAGLREVGEILRVEGNDKEKLAMPGFFLGEILYALHRLIIKKLHIEVRYNKENCNFLLYYILHTIASKIEAYHDRIYGIFGYEQMKLSIQDGAQENEKRMHKYYISYKKDLSRRYATDCLGDTLAVRALRASIGLDKTPTYKGVRATKEELDMQNSHFIMRINEQLSDKLEDVSSKRDKPKIHPLIQQKLQRSK